MEVKITIKMSCIITQNGMERNGCVLYTHTTGGDQVYVRDGVGMDVLFKDTLSC